MAEKEQDEITTKTTTNTESCRWGVDAGCSKGNTSESASSMNKEQQYSEAKFGIPKKINLKEYQSVIPPEGFALTTRVYTSTNDQLSYFDDHPAPLPFLEYCATTTTTGALPLQHAYFRQLLLSTGWEGAEFGPHTASLLITLQDDTTIELNSGQSQTFEAGAVILLEDVIGGGGHKIRSSATGRDEHHHGEVTVLLLTLLPTSRVVVGKEKSALTACDVLYPRRSMIVNKASRTLVLSMAGAVVSTALATFLAKVAPIWLSVAMGGGCLVAGGTYGFCQAGERIWQYLEERNYSNRKLKQTEDDEDEELETNPSKIEELKSTLSS
eukprot:CAMPEP_0178902102 /NCGR_PEP_ID=MMETSP0786-20121207/4420_1 /TAXON_ID=186022 /ORGANISM="Thalassionema frauenfeldii, Strain CCMP 1798" /LENGTH=325 /DNA_ID=CAMNT_0020573335 /DNA_START=189 /DNA_END=1169 /DNA_ORIENTATION=+